MTYTIYDWVAKNSVNIGIIGKYIDLKDAYKSLSEALYHSGIHNSTEIKIIWINAEKSINVKSSLKNLNGIYLTITIVFEL